MRLSVCGYVFSPLGLYLLNEWRYFTETDHNYSLPGPNDPYYIEKVTESKVKVSDGHRNVMNSTARKILNGFEPKLTQQEQAQTAYVRQEEYSLNPESVSGLSIRTPDYFQNLIGTSLSKDTSVIKFS